MSQLRGLCILSIAVSILIGHAKRIHLTASAPHEDAPISYKMLAQATAKYSSKASKSVDVTFGKTESTRSYLSYFYSSEKGARVAHLSRAGVNKAAFEGVSWQEPESTGLTSDDKYYINEYTGRFAYSRNVGVVLRGLTPYTEKEDPACKFKEQEDHAKLTLEVLKWAVGFGTAINRLPIPKDPVVLWRGAWETKSQIEQTRLYTSVPWFQPVSFDESYAPRFLSELYQPGVCKAAGCIETDHSYPVLYEFRTRAARDLREWNPKESEFMILPGTAFEEVSVKKIMNDKIMEMDTDALVAWLQRGDHRPVDPDSKARFGPFTELAEKVREKGWDGPKLLSSQEYVTINGPYDYHFKYLVELGINEEEYEYKLQGELTQALRNRYKLPPFQGRRGLASNSVSFYYKIELRDPAF